MDAGDVIIMFAVCVAKYRTAPETFGECTLHSYGNRNLYLDGEFLAFENDVAKSVKRLETSWRRIREGDGLS